MPYYAVSDGTRIYYEESGSNNTGETILFAHGLGSSHFELKSFIDEFNPNYRCVCYDHRGHGASDKASIHMNVKRLGQDMHELIEYLGLRDITIIGHSMGAATIFSYVNQFGTSRLKRIVSVDMTPYMRNAVWEGGLVKGKWTDEDFLRDIERIFDDVGVATWEIAKVMNPALANIPSQYESGMHAVSRAANDPLTFASLWYSLFRTDQRPVMSKIDVPFLYIMPENGLYSMITADYVRENVRGGFVLEKDFPGTTHVILMGKPKEVADCIKKFMNS